MSCYVRAVPQEGTFTFVFRHPGFISPRFLFRRLFPSVVPVAVRMGPSEYRTAVGVIAQGCASKSSSIAVMFFSFGIQHRTYRGFGTSKGCALKTGTK